MTKGRKPSWTLDPVGREQFRQGARQALQQRLDWNEDGWRSSLWEVTRFCKGFFKRDDGIISHAFEELSAFVQEYYGGWERLGGDLASQGVESIRVEFELTWRKIRYPGNKSPLDEAWTLARRYTFQSLRSQNIHEAPKYDRFLSLVCWLQFTVGEGKAVALPCRKIAETMGLANGHREVSRWLQLAVLDRSLVRVREHAFGQHKRPRAAEYRVADELWRWFRDEYAPRCQKA